MTTALTGMTAVVSALSTKIDERSLPRRLEGANLPTAGAGVATAAGVREAPARYSGEEPKDGAEGEAPENRRGPQEGRSDSA